MKRNEYVRVSQRAPHGERLRQISELLAAGPRTTAEIADALEIHPVLASTALVRFELLGHVKSGPALTGQPAKGNRSCKLWAVGQVAPEPRGVWEARPKWRRKPSGRPVGRPQLEVAPKVPRPPRQKAAVAVKTERAPKVQPAPAVRTSAPMKPVPPTPQTAAAARLNAQAWATATEKALPAVKAGEAESIEQFQRRGGRVEVLPPTQYIPAPQQPVGWKT